MVLPPNVCCILFTLFSICNERIEHDTELFRCGGGAQARSLASARILTLNNVPRWYGLCDASLISEIFLLLKRTRNKREMKWGKKYDQYITKFNPIQFNSFPTQRINSHTYTVHLFNTVCSWYAQGASGFGNNAIFSALNFATVVLFPDFSFFLFLLLFSAVFFWLSRSSKHQQAHLSILVDVRYTLALLFVNGNGKNMIHIYFFWKKGRRRKNQTHIVGSRRLHLCAVPFIRSFTIYTFRLFPNKSFLGAFFIFVSIFIQVSLSLSYMFFFQVP